MGETVISTGDEWIGGIPAHWDCEALRYLVVLNSQQSSYSPEHPYIALENIEPWTGNVVESDVEVSDNSTVNEFSAGDVLFGKLRPYLAKVVRAKYSGTSSTELLAFTPNKLTQGYLFYALLCKGFIDTVDSQTYGVKMPRTSWGQLRVMRFPVPPADEQVRITEHLDAECGRIDQMISIIEEQVEVLENYRKSLIQETVSRGLDPNSEMKPSGIDWIGDIPTGWRTTKLKGLVRRFESGTSVRAAQYPAIDGEPGVLSLSAVFQGRFNSGANKAVGEDEAPRLSCPVRYGTLLVSRCNTSEWVGTAALVDEECVNLYLPDKIWQIDCETELQNRYVRYALSSPAARAYCWMMSVGASESMQNMASFDLLNMRFAIPESSAEMQEVVEYLDNRTGKIDALLIGKRKQLETLRAHRQSIIYEYVTGKRRVV